MPTLTLNPIRSLAKVTHYSHSQDQIPGHSKSA